jgi:hypothetical protein
MGAPKRTDMRVIGYIAFGPEDRDLSGFEGDRRSGSGESPPYAPDPRAE